MSFKNWHLYVILFKVWSLLFWVVMFISALHGLVIKGPIQFYKNHESWYKDGKLSLIHWISLLLICIFFAYYEGYKGFQLAWSPMLVKRTYHFASLSKPSITLTNSFHIDSLIALMLGPMLAGGFICGTKRRYILSWGITVFIIIFVMIMRVLPNNSPWKCFIDIGVVIGLTWGLTFILIWWFKIGLLNVWPDWVSDEYPKAFVVDYPENHLRRLKKRISGTKDHASLTEIISI